MAMAEHWQTVAGFDGRYEVSSLGRVASLHRRRRVLKPYRRSDGYLTIGLHEGGHQTTVYVHRLVCEAFHGAAPSDDHEVAHENGDPGDDRADNLIWKLPAPNHADKRRHGTRRAGSSHPMVRLTEAQIFAVFELRASGLTLQAIADQVGIHLAHAGDILKRKVWADVAIPTELLTAVSATDGRRKGRQV
jgi:hypothetical protein